MDEFLLEFKTVDGEVLKLDYVVFKQVSWSFPKYEVRGTLSGREFALDLTPRDFYDYLKGHVLWPEIEEDFFIFPPK